MTDLEDEEEFEGEELEDPNRQAELEALRKAQEEREYNTRVRHLRKRMNRSNLEYEELKKKIQDMKARLEAPIPNPRICPPMPPALPPTLVRRRRRRHSLAGENEDVIDIGAGGDNQTRIF